MLLHMLQWWKRSPWDHSLTPGASLGSNQKLIKWKKLLTKVVRCVYVIKRITITTILVTDLKTRQKQFPLFYFWPAISSSNEEIRDMPSNIFKNMVRRKCKQSAFDYLINRRGKKGKDIKFNNLRMSEYLLPNDELDIKQQREIFAIRNEMTNIKSNFVSEKDNTTICIL